MIIIALARDYEPDLTQVLIHTLVNCYLISSYDTITYIGLQTIENAEVSRNDVDSLTKLMSFENDNVETMKVDKRKQGQLSRLIGLQQTFMKRRSFLPRLVISLLTKEKVKNNMARFYPTVQNEIK